VSHFRRPERALRFADRDSQGLTPLTERCPGFERRNGVIEYGGLPVNYVIAAPPLYLMDVGTVREFEES